MLILFHKVIVIFDVQTMSTEEIGDDLVRMTSNIEMKPRALTVVDYGEPISRL